MNRRSKNGVLEKLFEILPKEDIIKVNIGRSKGGLISKIHMVVSSNRTAG